MSKAFLREDDLGEVALIHRPIPSLAPGEKNYITPAGAHRLREALAELKHERAGLAVPPIAADTRRELQEIDERIHYLEESLRTAEIVRVPERPWNVVRFGAIVLVRDSDGVQSQYRIGGVDEADLSQDCVSWRSPIARALLHAKVGARVPFEFPGGKTHLEIVSIKYD
ncbi:MAG: GreA/GreB family elongation factor [Rariglobus sp.]|jgi:transcription elongation GreA/GreB family factor|nr:GreA/GreB family elongation factor [Rariglobus sp.]